MNRQIRAAPVEERDALVPVAKSKSKSDKKDKKEKKKVDDDEEPPVCHMPKSLIIVCSITEIAFCVIMTVWSRLNLSELSGPLGEDIKHHPKDTTTQVWLYWAVFATFLLARIIIALLWWKGSKNCHDSIYSGIFQLCSSLPFVFYLILYYWMAYLLTYSDGRQDVHMSLINNSTVTVAPGMPTHSFQCDLPYNTITCDASTRVNGVACCVQTHYKLKQPVTDIPHFLSMKSAFNLLSWGSILALTMIWKDDPLIKLDASDKEFLNGAWLDILDCVMFGKYIVHAVIVEPAKGIRDDDKREMIPDHSMWDATIWTWGVAFILTLLSPTLYTIFRYCDVDGDDHRSVANATEDLVAHIRLLDDEGCKKFVSEAIQLTKKDYLEAAHDSDDEDAEEHPVMVFSDDKFAGPAGFSPVTAMEGFVGDVEEGREGMATLAEGEPSFYDVVYKDGSKDESVPVSRIHADLAAHSTMCGPKCCWGWCRTKQLSPHGKHAKDIFERRSKFLDSIRSFFFLELPFLCFRIYFDVICGHGVTILLVKNAVWGFVDIATIIACGHEKAQCLSVQPIIGITKLVASSKLNKIMVAPAGLFRVATDMAVSSMKSNDEAEKRKLNEHKAWLILEREKLESHDDDEHNQAAYADYSAEINKLEKRTKAIEKIEKGTHA